MKFFVVGLFLFLSGMVLAQHFHNTLYFIVVIAGICCVVYGFLKDED